MFVVYGLKTKMHQMYVFYIMYQCVSNISQIIIQSVGETLTVSLSASERNELNAHLTGHQGRVPGDMVTCCFGLKPHSTVVLFTKVKVRSISSIVSLKNALISTQKMVR